MSAIEVDEMYPMCRRRNATGEEELPMSLDEIRQHWRAGWYVGLYVDGWSAPWGCFEDDFGVLRAQCPTAPKVVPSVIHVSREGAVHTGKSPPPRCMECGGDGKTAQAESLVCPACAGTGMDGGVKGRML